MNKFPWFQSTDDKTYLSHDPVNEKYEDAGMFIVLLVVLVPFVWYITELTK